LARQVWAFPRLKCLLLDGSRLENWDAKQRVPPLWLRQLCAATSLVYLSLNGVPGVGDATARTLTAELPRLQRLGKAITASACRCLSEI